jgi:3-dehydroquinate dehydratase-2
MSTGNGDAAKAKPAGPKAPEAQAPKAAEAKPAAAPRAEGRAPMQPRPKPIFVLNGPNLNMLGTREPAIYGYETLADIVALCRESAEPFGHTVDARQSNHEGLLVDWVQEARTHASGIVINPAAYTHTSVALRDAIAAVDLPVVEVHISNVHQREAFRHHSHISPVATGVIAGLGIEGYRAAIDFICRKLNDE